MEPLDELLNLAKPENGCVVTIVIGRFVSIQVMSKDREVLSYCSAEDLWSAIQAVLKDIKIET